MFSDFSNYTPHCIDFVKAFKGVPCITTHEVETCNEDGTFSDFDGAIFFERMECLLINNFDGKYMLFTNNPLCLFDSGCFSAFGDVQLVFGYYDTFEKAIERAKEIVRARKYPTPIEIW